MHGVIKILNSFPGHHGVPGKRGGSLPKNVPPLPTNQFHDVSGYPAHNVSAQWSAKKMKYIEGLHLAGNIQALKDLDTAPKSIQPNKYQKDLHAMHKKVLALNFAQHKPAEPEVKAPEGTTKLSDGHFYPSSDVTDVTNWKKVGGQLGSNPGYQAEDENGKKWYVKESKSNDHALNEMLAAKLYQAAGSPVLDYHLADLGNGKLGTATPWETNSSGQPLKTLAQSGVKNPAGIQNHFATHAWLANYDAIGLENDNQGTSGNGWKTLDVGGALKYRAMGKLKDKFDSNVVEWDSMRDPSVNPQAAAVFEDMTPEQLKASADKVMSISPEVIAKTVMTYGGGSDQDKANIVALLGARRNDLKNRLDFEVGNLSTPSPVSQAESNPLPAVPKEAKSLPLPPQVNSPTNPGAQKKLNALYEAAKTGDQAQVAQIATNSETKNIYGKMAHKYKLSILEAMQGGAKAISIAPTVAPSAPSKLVTEKDLPKDPDFISSKKANVEANKLAVEKYKQKFLEGDIGFFKAVPPHPSPKLTAYKDEIISILQDKLFPPTPPKSYSGAFHELAKTAKIQTVKDASAKVGYFLVVGNPGVITHEYGSGKELTAGGSWAKKHSEAYHALPATQQSAIKSYTGSAYASMNPAFRSGSLTPKEKTAGMGLLKASQEIPEGSLIHRKLTLTQSQINEMQNHIGHVLQEPAIMSTSTDGTWHGNTHIHMIAGPDVRGLYVGSGTGISSHTHENEIAMPPNTRILIQKVIKSGTGSIIHAIILPTEDNQCC